MSQPLLGQCGGDVTQHSLPPTFSTICNAVLAFLSREREAMTVGTATGPLLSGPVRGAQFHPRGAALRRLATHTDHRHRRARAGVRRSAVSSKTFDRLDGAWARGAALLERNRAQRG